MSTGQSFTHDSGHRLKTLHNAHIIHQQERNFTLYHAHRILPLGVDKSITLTILDYSDPLRVHILCTYKALSHVLLLYLLRQFQDSSR